MAFKVAVFQPDSFYGKMFCKHFDDNGYTVLPYEFCFDDESQALASLEKFGPALVIVPEASDSSQQNMNLAAACGHCAIPLIYLSSHRVFAQTQGEGALLENLAPILNGVVAEQLFEAEASYLSTNSVILRLPWVVDDEDQLLQQICAALIAEAPVVASDQWRASLVDTHDVVRVVFAIAQQITCGAKNWGVYHLRSSDDCSEAELVDRIRRILEKAGCNVLSETQVVSMDQRMFESNGWLGGNRCTNDFGIQLRSWRQGLKSKTVKWISKQVDMGRVVLHPSK